MSLALCKGMKDVSLIKLIKEPKLKNSIRPIPLYAVPYNAGTGSEVIPFATVWDY